VIEKLAFGGHPNINDIDEEAAIKLL